MHLLSQNMLLYLFLSHRISKHVFFSGSANNSIFFFIFIKIPLFFFIGNKLPFTVRETRDCIIKSRKASDLSVGAGLEGTVKAICHQLRRVGGLGGLQAAGPGVPECGRSGSGAGGGPAAGPARCPPQPGAMAVVLGSSAGRGGGAGLTWEGGRLLPGAGNGGVGPSSGSQLLSPARVGAQLGRRLQPSPGSGGTTLPGVRLDQEEPRGGSGSGPAAFSGAGAQGKRRRSGGRAGGRRGGRSRARPRHAGVEGRWQDRNRRVVGLRGRAPHCRGIPAPGTSRVASFSVVFAQKKRRRKKK